MGKIQNLTFRSAAKLPRPSLEGTKDKNERGRVLAIVGSFAAPGAALLSGEACFRAGAGKVQLATSAKIATSVGLALRECGLVPLKRGKEFKASAQQADAFLIGPGMTNRNVAMAMLWETLAHNSSAPIVLDAIALSFMWRERRKLNRTSNQLILTPHHGEMAEMLGINIEKVASAPLQYALQVSEELGAIVVLKGQTTWVTGAGKSWRHSGGCVGLAVSGSGDVLAGIITGLVATGAEPTTAALRGVAVHAEAGRRLSDTTGHTGFLAGELLGSIPGLLNMPA